MNFAGENVIEACACGRDEVIERCCLPYIEGRAKPDSAEALMRARYTAYTRRTVDFIVASHDPARRSELDVEAIKRWAEQSEWLQLEILQAQQGAAGDKSGTVEFRVHYRLHGATHVLHEISHFIHKQGQWFYKEGQHPTLKPVIRTGTKVGRNDPCPCGSGKKHKKCCMTEEVINVS